MKNHLKKRGLVQLDETVAGPLFMLSAALLFTLLNLLIKLIGPDYKVWDIGFYRFMATNATEPVHPRMINRRILFPLNGLL